MASGSHQGEDMQVLVTFVTKLPNELRVPEAPMAVPASLKRLDLSTIINRLLELDPARPFDFIIGEHLVRKSLKQHLLDHQLSTESNVVVEYVPAVVPLEQQKAAPHDDWVSAVDVAPLPAHGPPGAMPVASGSYDGCVRLWRGPQLSGPVALVSGAHAGGVTAAKWLPGVHGAGADGSRLLLTAGRDHVARLWRCEGVDGGDGGDAVAVTAVASFAGHTDTVEGVAVSPSGSAAATCGWDSAVLLWRGGAAVAADADAGGGGGAAAAENNGAAAAAKKRKVKGGGSAAAAAAARVESPTGRLEGHLHCVSSVAWPAEGVIFSGGWDHSVRRWDAGSGVCTDTYNGSKAVHAVAARAPRADVVAFGGGDAVVRLWDARARRGEALATAALAPHAGWVSAIAWSPHDEHRLASASHDGRVKLWDDRCAAVPLATLAAHADKALCVAWMRGSGGGDGDGIVSGGSDCQLVAHTAAAAAAPSA